MVTTRFNPFDKDLKDLQLSDLAVLRDVSEGWYVEYKRQLLDVERIARSIGSFANQYGGWLFFGIKQGDDGRETAGAFDGIPSDEIQPARMACRNAVLTKLSPAPYFDLKFIEGPSEELGLAAGRGILALWIPQGMDPPYVHSSGIIYRRVADGSDPKPETDRHILELLWKRGRQSRKRLADRFLRRPIRSKAESEATYIHVHILADPLDDRELRSRMTFDQFAGLMQRPPGVELNMPFDNIFTASNDYVARQAKDNPPWSLLTTWRYGGDCSSLVTLPCNQVEAAHSSASIFMRGYKYAEPLLQHLRSADFTPCRVLDLNFLCVSLQSIVIQHRALAAADGVFGPFYFRASLDNVWRRIPFLDLQSYNDWIGKVGVPVVQDRNALAPEGTDYAGMVEIPERTEELLSAATAATDAILPLMEILKAVGIPPKVLADSEGEFLMLVERAKEAQRLRNRAAVPEVSE